MGRAMLSNSLFQFSVDELGCVPSLLFALRQIYGGGNEDIADLLQRSHAHSAILSALKRAAGTANPHFYQRLLETHGKV